MKPDLVAFGGEGEAGFRVLAPGRNLKVVNQMGTSFASPYLLRQAVELRIMGGDDLSLLSIKTLLIHHADRGENDSAEVGWGRPPAASDILNGYADTLRYLFQGRLEPGKFLRADLPKPFAGYSEPVKIKATFCYKPPVDSYDPSSYTKAALDICFVPDINAEPDQKGHLPVKVFFDMDGGVLDENQDAEAILWANIKCNENEMEPSILSAPSFDVRHVDRGSGSVPDSIEYSLIVDVRPTPADLKTLESELASVN